MDVWRGRVKGTGGRWKAGGGWFSGAHRWRPVPDGQVDLMNVQEMRCARGTNDITSEMPSHPSQKRGPPLLPLPLGPREGNTCTFK